MSTMKTTVKDTDGKTISVAPSSGVAVGSFRGPFVWVTIPIAHVNDDEAYVHLTRAQAKRVRDALSRFVDLGER